MKKAIKIIFLSVGGFFVFCFFVGLMLPDQPRTSATAVAKTQSSAKDTQANLRSKADGRTYAEIAAKDGQKIADQMRQYDEALARAEAKKAAVAAEPDRSAGAYVACKNYVRRSLKSPSSADFPFLDYKSWKIGGGKYKIVSYVDAQNGFGAMLRMNYGCFAETSDGSNFTVTKLENYSR